MFWKEWISPYLTAVKYTGIIRTDWRQLWRTRFKMKTRSCHWWVTLTHIEHFLSLCWPTLVCQCYPFQECGIKESRKAAVPLVQYIGGERYHLPLEMPWPHSGHCEESVVLLLAITFTTWVNVTHFVQGILVLPKWVKSPTKIGHIDP
jgi:hypothetical protein